MNELPLFGRPAVSIRNGSLDIFNALPVKGCLLCRSAIKVKQPINPVIRAHLLRGAFHLILLVAVCVIPFALGQRATTKQSAVADPLLLGSGPVATLSTSDDPAGGTWTLTGSLNTARYLHTATLLPNGMVLVAGGFDSNLQCFRERGTVRSGERDLDCHRQPQHRTLCSHGDLAAKRHGPCCRGI